MRFIPYSTSTIIQTTRIQKENRNALSFLACHSLKKIAMPKRDLYYFILQFSPRKPTFMRETFPKL